MANTRITNTPSQAIPQDGALHTQRTVSSAAVNVLNWTLNDNTQNVMLQFNGGSVRVTFDGTTTPTSTKGFLYTDGSSGYWTRNMLSKAKAIRAGSTDVVAEIQELNHF